MTISKIFLEFQNISRKKLRTLDLLALKGELTKEVKIKLLTTNDLASLEDLHDSYSSNNQTKGSLALGLGMEPLANILWRQEKNVVPETDALAFFEEKSEISSRDQALSMARNIIAERIRDNKEAKKELRNFIRSNGTLTLEITREDHAELTHYKKYFPSSPLPLTGKLDHLFEILKAESKGIVLITINIPQEQSLKLLEKFFIKRDCAASQHVRMAMEDSYQRFLLPYMETEIRSQLLEDAFLKRISLPMKPIALLIFIPIFLLSLLAFKAIPHPIPGGINGQIISFNTYKNGLLDGESREYYDNGQRKSIKNYSHGELEGFAKEYDKQGRLQSSTYYHKNIPLSRPSP